VLTTQKSLVILFTERHTSQSLNQTNKTKESKMTSVSLDKELNSIILGLSGQQLEKSIYITKEHLSEAVHVEYESLCKLLGTDKVFGLYSTNEGIKLNRPKIVLDLSTMKMGLATVGGCIPIKAKNVTVSVDGSQINFEGEPSAEGESEFYSYPVNAAIKPGSKGVISLRDLQSNPQDVLNPGGVTPPIEVSGKLLGLDAVTYKEGTPDEFTSYLVNVGGYQFGLNKAVASVWSKLVIGADATYSGRTFVCGDITVNLGGAPKVAEMPDGEYPIKSVRQATVQGKESSWLQAYAVLEAGECRIPPAMFRTIKQQLDGDNLKIVVSDGSARIELTKDTASVAARFKGAFKMQENV
jgi:hypothetical protein